MSVIPIVSLDDCEATATTLRDSFEKYGFLLLEQQHISENSIKTAFQVAKQFFALPSELKRSLTRGTVADENAGYVQVGMESLDSVQADRKEALNLTQYPWKLTESTAFLSQLEPFYEEAWSLGIRLLEILTTSFTEERALLSRYHSFQSLGVYRQTKKVQVSNASTLRLLHYPALEEHYFQRETVLAGAHSDYGTITLLFQDTLGGLQIYHASSESWIDVPADNHFVVVNSGDLLERWTGGIIPSTKHRVVATPDMKTTCSGRYSIALFIHPDDNTIVQPFAGNQEKYQKITATDFLSSRFQASYS
eukprot:jgi/Galph1/4030/GphlegSOOS_G2692.1